MPQQTLVTTPCGWRGWHIENAGGRIRLREQKEGVHDSSEDAPQISSTHLHELCGKVMAARLE